MSGIKPLMAAFSAAPAAITVAAPSTASAVLEPTMAIAVPVAPTAPMAVATATPTNFRPATTGGI